MGGPAAWRAHPDGGQAPPRHEALRTGLRPSAWSADRPQSAAARPADRPTTGTSHPEPQPCRPDMKLSPATSSLASPSSLGGQPVQVPAPSLRPRYTRSYQKPVTWVQPCSTSWRGCPPWGCTPGRARLALGLQPHSLLDRAGGTLGPHRQALHCPGHATKALPPLGSPPGRAQPGARAERKEPGVHLAGPQSPLQGWHCGHGCPPLTPSRGQGG